MRGGGDSDHEDTEKEEEEDKLNHILVWRRIHGIRDIISTMVAGCRCFRWTATRSATTGRSRSGAASGRASSSSSAPRRVAMPSPSRSSGDSHSRVVTGGVLVMKVFTLTCLASYLGRIAPRGREVAMLQRHLSGEGS
jgi:hypothetical protein